MIIQSIADVIKEIIHIYKGMESRRVDVGFLGVSMRSTNAAVAGLDAYVQKPEDLPAYLQVEIAKLADGAKSKSLLQLLLDVALFLKADSTVSPEAIVASFRAFATQQESISPLSATSIQQPGFVALATSWFSAKPLQQDTTFLNDCRDLLLAVIDFIGRTKPSFNESSEAKIFKQSLGLDALREQTDLENQQSVLRAALALLPQVDRASAAAAVGPLTDSVVEGDQKGLLAVIQEEQRVTVELTDVSNQIKPTLSPDILAPLQAKKQTLEIKCEQLRSTKQTFLHKIASNPAAAALAAQNLQRQLEGAQAELLRVGMWVDQAVAQAEERFKAQLKAETDKQQKARAAVEQEAQESAARCAELELALHQNAEVVSARDGSIEGLQQEIRQLRALELALRSETQRLKVQATRDKKDLETVHADFTATHAFYHIAPNELFTIITEEVMNKLLELRLSDFEFSARFQKLMSLAQDIDFADANFLNYKIIYSQLVMQQKSFAGIYSPLFEADYKMSAGKFSSLQSQYQDLFTLFMSIMTKCRTDQNISVSFSGKTDLTPAEKFYIKKSNFLKACAACAEACAKRFENLMGKGVVKALGQDSYASFIARFAPFCQRNLALINTSAEAKHQKSMVTVQAGLFPPAPSVPVAAAAASVPVEQQESDADSSSEENWSDADENTGDDAASAAPLTRLPSP